MRKINHNTIIKYLPVLIILLSISIMVGSTFAYFTDKVDRSSTLTFSKVELSSETTTGINGSMRDAIPGATLVDGVLKFSKSIDSESIYVRAKLSFSSDSNTEGIDTYLDALRTSEKLGIIKTVQNNAVWSEKEGNYFYLLNEDGLSLKSVDDTYTYILSENMVVPYDLDQLPNLAQYMEVINFHIAFQAIQVDNITSNMESIKELFDLTFPESDKEKVSYILSINNNNDSYITSSKVFAGDIIDEPETPIKINHEFAGWYLQDGSESGDWGEMVTFPLRIASDTTLYAKWESNVIVATYNGMNYYSVEEAVADANAVNSGVVRIEADATITNDITISSGVTLLVPYNETDNAFEDTTSYASRTATIYGNVQYIYRTLTINEGVTLSNNGVITIGSVIGVPMGGYSGGGTGGMHGVITNNGTIINNDGATMNVYGYIDGTGVIENMSGSLVYQPFIIIGFGGGTITIAHYNSIGGMIVNRYTLENIRCINRLRYGSKMIGRMSLYTSGTYFINEINFISNEDSSLFQMISDGYIETMVNDTTLSYDTLNIDYFVDTNFNSYNIIIGLIISGFSFSIELNTADNYFPLPYDIEWHIHNNFNINNKIKILTGTKFEICEGATVTAYADVIAYSEFKDSYTILPYPNLDAAKFICNGTFISNSGFGGIVTSSVVGANIKLGTITTISSLEMTSTSESSILSTAETQTITETARGLIDGDITNFIEYATYTWDGEQYIKEGGGTPDLDENDMVASLNGQNYSLLEALSLAVSGDIVTLIKDIALTQDLTIPSGVTLLIPYGDSTDAYIEESTITLSSTVVNNASYNYVTMYINEGVTLINNGIITVAGTLSSFGSTGGNHGLIVNNGTIINNNTLNVYGYITGLGLIENKSSSVVNQPFTIVDYRDETYYNLYITNVTGFPFNRYTFENVRCDTIYNYGSNLITRMSLFTKTLLSSSFSTTTINIIGQDSSCLYCINNGYIETSVQDSTYAFDTLVMKHNGNITFNLINATIRFSLINRTFDSSLNYMALPCDILWEIESGDFTLINQLKVLPGSKIEVKEGATFTANSNLMVYSEFNDEYTTNPYPSLSAGEFICDGTFIANSGFAGLIKSANTIAVVKTGVITSLSCDEVTRIITSSSTSSLTTQTITETARGIIGGVETDLDANTTYIWNGSEYVIA